MILREYQQQLIDSMRDGYRSGAQRILAVSPTGSGKTVTFAFVTKSASSKGKRVMIVAHRSEILQQISSALRAVEVEHGVIQSGKSMDQTLNVQVASIGTLVRRFDKVVPPDLIVVDEAHHSMAQQWIDMFAAFPKAQVLGVTATPERLDGKGLSAVYHRLVLGPSVQWLIDRGFLAKPIYFAPKQIVDVSVLKKVAGDYSKGEAEELLNKPSITGDVIQHYRKCANGLRAVVFCVNLRHAEMVADSFRASGIPAASIDGTLTDADRKQRVADLSSGRIPVLTSCEIVSEGFDLPSVGAAILLRPTTSLALHLQQIGRALRPSEGKRNAIILDHVGNCLRHGLAEEEREWSLEGYAARKRKTDDVRVECKQCSKCYAIFVGKICPQCGSERELSQREIEEREGELVRLEEQHKAALLARHRKREEWACKSREDFIKLGRARGYKNPEAWAFFRIKNSKRRDLVAA